MRNKGGVFDNVASVVSVVFHPLLMPVYGFLIIFSAPTLFGYLPFEVKKLLIMIILVNNVLVPLLLFSFLRFRNIISSWSMVIREERIIPLLSITLLYAATSYIFSRFPVPVFIKSFVIAAFMLSFIITVISLFWKISIHSAGVGAITALVIILALKMYSALSWYLIMVIIVSGIVLSSRLKLNSHNPQQVWIGYIAGFAGLSLSMGLI